LAEAPPAQNTSSANRQVSETLSLLTTRNAPAHSWTISADAGGPAANELQLLAVALWLAGIAGAALSVPIFS
jgi:hypothetical protein